MRKYAAAKSSSQTEHLISEAMVNEDGMSSLGSERQPASISITPCSTIQHNNNLSMVAMEGTTPQKLDSNASSVPIVSEYTTTFIPPSEREDLPKNLIVTSVEISWRTNRRCTARQDANKAQPWTPPDDTHTVQLPDPGLHRSPDWGTIETAWDKYETLNALMELLPDNIVAWKVLSSS